MDTNVRLPRRMRRYFSSICVLSVFVMVFLGPGTIIATLAQAFTFLNIGNFMGSIGNMVSSITGFGKGGPCHFTCPDGGKPRPNPVHASTTNGCGVFGFQVDSQLFPAVTTCCEKHDFCYDKCNSDKSKCDTDFQTCLRVICKNLHRATGGTELYEGCVSIADLVYKATDAGGCKAFQESQSNACICDGPGGANKKPPPPAWKGTDQNSTAVPNADTPPGSNANVPPERSASEDTKEAPADSFTKNGKKPSASFDDGNQKTQSQEKSQQGQQDTRNAFGQEDSQGNVVYDHVNIIKANMDKINDRQHGKYEDRKKGPKGSGKKKRPPYNDEESDEDSDRQGGKYARRKVGQRKEEF